MLEQLKKISEGDYKSPITERRKSGAIVFAAVSLPVQEIQNVLGTVSGYVYEPLWFPPPAGPWMFFQHEC